MDFLAEFLNSNLQKFGWEWRSDCQHFWTIWEICWGIGEIWYKCQTLIWYFNLVPFRSTHFNSIHTFNSFLSPEVFLVARPISSGPTQEIEHPLTWTCHSQQARRVQFLASGSPIFEKLSKARSRLYQNQI